MARTELFDLFFHPVFQKCLKHAEASMTPEGKIKIQIKSYMSVVWSKTIQTKRETVSVQTQWLNQINKESKVIKY